MEIESERKRKIKGDVDVLTILFDGKINYKLCIMRIVTCSVESREFLRGDYFYWSYILVILNILLLFIKILYISILQIAFI